MTCAEIVSHLQSLANPANIAGMARYGISTAGTLGVSIPVLRGLARDHRRDHALALDLWNTGLHEARILASLVDDPRQATDAQLVAWAGDFDSWDVCDQCCANLFDRTPFAHRKALEWADDGREFVRRAGFVMMAALAVHDTKADDAAFEPFFPAIKRYATDDRNFVRKAVNWALRNVGKRNLALNRRAIEVAEEIRAIDSRAVRWIAADALRELQGDKVQQRLREKAARPKKR